MEDRKTEGKCKLIEEKGGVKGIRPGSEDLSEGRNKRRQETAKRSKLKKN